MFTAVLFIMGKIWKPPKCPSIDEWIKKMWYMHTHAKIISHRMDLEGIRQSEIAHARTNTV